VKGKKAKIVNGTNEKKEVNEIDQRDEIISLLCDLVAEKNK